MLNKRLFLIFFLLGWVWSGYALEIKGTVKLNENWQPKIFLAALNSPDELFVASPDFIIAETFIQPDGRFLLSTESVPADMRFYRLYMVRGNQSSVEFNPTNSKNYVHLLLTRSSVIEINALIYNNAFDVTSLTGSDESLAILDFDNKYQKQKSLLSGDLTKAKSNYLSHELEVFIHKFVKESSNSLIGLYALYHIDEKDMDFLRNSDFYFDFQKRLENDFSSSLYTQAYDDLLNDLVGFRDVVCQMPELQIKWKNRLLAIQSSVIFILLILVLWLLINRKKTGLIKSENETKKKKLNGLTSKQQEILKLLAVGKTNKEIAQELFIELSTVKTHINNIYRQLGVGSRKEAADHFNSL